MTKPVKVPRDRRKIAAPNPAPRAAQHAHRRTRQRTALLASALLFASTAPSPAQAQLAPPQELPRPQNNPVQPRVLRVDGHVLPLDFAIPAGAAEHERIHLRGRGTLGHIWWPDPDADPDAPLRHVLVALTSPPVLLHTWTDAQNRTLSARDLNGDGRDALLRDLPGSAPCGLEVHRAPEVFDFARSEFRPVSIAPNTDGAAPAQGTPRALEPSVASLAFDASSHIPTFVGYSALNDADPATAWTENAPGTGAGQWIALQTPADTPEGAVTALRLSTQPGDAPLQVLIQFDDGATFTAHIDEHYRELPVQTQGRCALVSAIDVGGRASFSLSEAALVTRADALTPAQRAERLWPESIHSACEAGDLGRAYGFAQRAAADAPQELPAMALDAAAQGQLCTVQALLHARTQDADALRVTIATANDTDLEVTLTLLSEVSDPSQINSLYTALSEQQRTPSGQREEAIAGALIRALTAAPGADLTAFFTTLMALPLRTERIPQAPSSQSADAIAAMSPAEGHAPGPAPQALAPQGPPLRVDTPIARTALQAASHGTFGFVDVWNAADTNDARILALRLALAAPHLLDAPDIADALRPAFNHENGSVARLAVTLAGASGMNALTPELTDIAAHDPIGHMRAAAVRALDALDALEIERFIGDDDAEVRLALATSTQAQQLLLSEAERASGDSTSPGQTVGALQRVLASETWPEVRVAWAATAIRAEHRALDDTLAAHLATAARSELAAALRAWTTRGTSAPEAALTAGRAQGAHPETLAYTIALSPLSTAGCDTEWLRSMRAMDETPENLRAVIDSVLEACAP